MKDFPVIEFRRYTTKQGAAREQFARYFAGYRDAGVREAGVLVTLDVPNTSRGFRSGRTAPISCGSAS